MSKLPIYPVQFLRAQEITIKAPVKDNSDITQRDIDEFFCCKQYSEQYDGEYDINPKDGTVTIKK